MDTSLTTLHSVIEASFIPSRYGRAAHTGGKREPDHFAMSCGVVVPVYREMMEEVALDMLAQRRGDPERVSQDPRFAIAIYRAALNSGILNNVTDK